MSISRKIAHKAQAVKGAFKKTAGRLTGSRLDALVDYLSDRCLLLVLDTCEHLTGACAELAVRLLLMPSRGTRILATSRQSLGVPGGLTVAIGPLPLHDAVTVFGRRAAEAAPRFRVTPENQAIVAAICRSLNFPAICRRTSTASGSVHRRLLPVSNFLTRSSEWRPPAQ